MTDDPLGAVGARAEARGLFRMLGHDGNTVEDLRELIAVPPRTERALRAYADKYPAEARWIDGTLKFRLAVAREFERLLQAGVPLAELRAMDIRIRASQRAGELIAQMPKAVGAKGNPGGQGAKIVRSSETTTQKTLADLGISKDQSSQWQQLAGIDPEEVEKELPMSTGKRTSVKKVEESEQETIGRAFANAQA